MGDLINDLQQLAHLHQAGVLNDEEFRAAKQARIAGDAQPTAAVATPATASGPRETCEIKVVHVEHHSISRSVWRYIAVATGPKGQYEAARSPDFKANADYWAFEYFPSSCDERDQAFNYVVQTLYSEGWEQLPYEGEHWWNKRFQRAANRGLATRPQTPHEFESFQPPDNSFSVTVPSSWVHSHKHDNFAVDRWIWEGHKLREHRPNLIVLRQKPGLINFTLDRWTKWVMKRGKDVQVSDIQVAGKSARRASYYLSARSEVGTEVVGLAWNGMWQLSLNCYRDEHSVYGPLFDRFVHSFKLLQW